MRERNRQRFSPSQKADLLRKHHVETVPISETCNQNERQPSVLYGWQHHLWDHAALAFAEAKPCFPRSLSTQEKTLASSERAVGGA